MLLRKACKKSNCMFLAFRHLPCLLHNLFTLIFGTNLYNSSPPTYAGYTTTKIIALEYQQKFLHASSPPPPNPSSSFHLNLTDPFSSSLLYPGFSADHDPTSVAGLNQHLAPWEGIRKIRSTPNFPDQQTIDFAQHAQLHKAASPTSPFSSFSQQHQYLGPISVETSADQHYLTAQSPRMPHTPSVALVNLRAASMGNIRTSYSGYGGASSGGAGGSDAVGGNVFASPGQVSNSSPMGYPQARMSSAGSSMIRDNRGSGVSHTLPPITSFRPLSSPRVSNTGQLASPRSSSSGNLALFRTSNSGNVPLYRTSNSGNVNGQQNGSAAGPFAQQTPTSGGVRRTGLSPLAPISLHLSTSDAVANNGQSSVMTWEAEAGVGIDAVLLADDAVMGEDGLDGGEQGLIPVQEQEGAQRVGKKASGKAPMKATSQYKGVTKCVGCVLMLGFGWSRDKLCSLVHLLLVSAFVHGLRPAATAAELISALHDFQPAPTLSSIR